MDTLLTSAHGITHAHVSAPRAGAAWRALRTLVLAVGPVASIWFVAHSAAISAAIGAANAGVLVAAVICVAWSPLLPAGAHALLCVDERAEYAPRLPWLLRELAAWPAMLVCGRARLETWASTLGVVAAWNLWWFLAA
jgi:hypothetical protein